MRIFNVCLNKIHCTQRYLLNSPEPKKNNTTHRMNLMLFILVDWLSKTVSHKDKSF